ncbi:MAG: AAA family ATPase [Acetobacteraceae bacterium]|jgi:polysaccharide biosynthesis transport protein
MLDRPAGTPHPPAMGRRERPQAGLASDAATPDGAAILAILRRRKWLLLAPMLLCPLLAYVALSQFNPRYTATGTLLYDANGYNVRELQSILRVDPITDAIMASQAEVLRGMPVVEQVARELNLLNNPEFNASLRRPPWPRQVQRVIRLMLFHPPPASLDEPAGPTLDPARNATLSAVQAALIVTPLKASHVLEVSFTAEDPVIAAAAVNNAMDLYVKSQLGAKYGAVARAQQWLEQRRDELREELRRSEDAIAQYRARNGLVEGMHARLDSEQVSLLTENLTRARSALAEAEGKLDAASGRAGAAAQAAIAPSVVQLRARHDQLSAELQSMLARFGGSHPDVQAVRAQLAEVDRNVAAESGRVVAAIDADVRADHERVDALQHDLSEQHEQIAHDAEAQVPLNAMSRDADAARGLLQAMLERIQQTAQQASIQAPDAHEISLALVPDRPSFPRTGQWMAAATTFGVVLGLLVVYVRELADNTFQSGDDVRTVLGLPCFALIPRMSRRTLRGITVEDYAARKPRSALAEQLRALRAGLSLWPGRPRIIAVTAAHPQEGKTTVTKALGRLAAMNGERVIMVDCDIRHPSPTDSGDRPGLVDFLRERVPLSEVIQKNPATGMDYVPSGKGEANALGLLMSATMARMLQSLRDDYDLVLLDTPPAEVITDARIVSGLAEATLFCVRWRGTSHHNALHALELLEEAHANVVGAALTQVDISVHRRSGYADAEVYHPRYGGYFRE